MYSKSKSIKNTFVTLNIMIKLSLKYCKKKLPQYKHRNNFVMKD